MDTPFDKNYSTVIYNNCVLENYVFPDKLECVYLSCRHKDKFRFTLRDLLKSFHYRLVT